MITCQKVSRHGGKYKYQGRERHEEIGETENEHVGSGKQFVRNHVMRDLYIDLNYTLLSVYYICYFKYKIKTALGEFDIRCLFIVLLCQYSVSYPPS